VKTASTVIIEIKKSDLIYWLRWLAFPLVMLAILLLTYFSTEFLAKNGLGRRWIEPVAFFQVGLAGAVAVGSCVPRWKTILLLILTVIALPFGFQMAARFDPITQQPTILPIGAGLLGAFLGIGIIAAWEYRSYRRRRARDSELGK